MNLSRAFDGFDEADPICLAGVTCHIEIDTKGGATPKEVAMRTAATLRATAESIEAGLLDTGFHPVKDPGGTKLGTLYLDFYGEEAM